MIIVTGAAGFVGANNVKALNGQGIDDIIAVDNLTKSEKFRNLADCEIADYLDKRDFLELVRSGRLPKPEVVFHQGACSDTMETDGRYMLDNNYRYSLELMRWCQDQGVPLMYASSASVYGLGPDIRRRPREREAAERLRILQIPVRPDRPARAAATEGSGHRSALLQRLRAARGAQGPNGVGRVPSLQPVPRRRQGPAVRRQPRLRQWRSSGATSFMSTTSSRQTCTSGTARSPGIYNARHRARTGVQRRCTGGRQYAARA